MTGLGAILYSAPEGSSLADLRFTGDALSVQETLPDGQSHTVDIPQA